MRVILHSDLNACYASIECLQRPELKDVPMAVGGDPEKRHGIILAKNQLAKQAGVKTAEPLWQARAKCPGLVIVPPHYQLYWRYCQQVRQIYLSYTNLVEPFGIDESWLDVTSSQQLFGSGEVIAEAIRQRVKSETGLTVSIGVSFNKVFAKLGSDYKKPDAVTVVSPENFRRIVWPLPAADLLFVGRATVAKLSEHGIQTIGQLAETPEDTLSRLLGKQGALLSAYANGLDTSPVLPYDSKQSLKSVSNGATPPHDIRTPQEGRILLLILAESVAERLREHGLLCRTVQLGLRQKSLRHFQRQRQLARPTALTKEIYDAACQLLYACYDWREPLRSLTISADDVIPANEACWQPSLFENEAGRGREEKLERVLDGLRERFGRTAVQRGAVLLDSDFRQIDPRFRHD